MNQVAIAFIKRYWDEMLLVTLVVSLIVLSAVKTIEVETVKTDLATARLDMRTMQLDAERTANELSIERTKAQTAHAAGQQEKEQEYAKERQRQIAARADDQRELGRLRNAIKTYAAGGGSTSGVDAPAGVSQEDRLDRLAALLDEGVGLALEGRGVVERRDAEVKRLLGQIAIDRQACSATRID